MIELTRRYRFPAAHVLAHPSLSQAENDRIYGKCANPAGHGHDYAVEVTVRGAVDPVSGLIMDRGVLDRLVEEKILARFGHSMLNEDSAFTSRVPTAENIAAVIHEELAGAVAESSGVQVVRVRLEETRKNSFVHGELT